jgi:uncharacterized protein (TIGR02145 family)
MKILANILISMLGLASAICSAQTPAQLLEQVMGRSQGKEKSIEVSSAKPSEGKKGESFVDKRDGKAYNTVAVGNQVWTAENISFKPSGAQSWAYDNDENNSKKYGRLYTWKAAQEACPQGWRLPSEKDWASLIDFLGGENLAGTKLKASGDDWSGRNTSGRNESGFSLLPAGSRAMHKRSDDFQSLGRSTTLWTSTATTSRDAVVFSILEGDSVIRATSNHDAGMSVRCIK